MILDWKLRKRDDRYEVYDLHLKDFTLSTTRLNKGKSTTGHSHPWEEVYYIMKGWGRLIVGEATRKIADGDLVFIPGGAFHRVFNDDCPGFVFLCVFKERND